MIADMRRVTGNIVLVAILLSLAIIPGAAGCTGNAPDSSLPVTFDQLLSRPRHYNDKNITIEGFVFLGFETIVLSEELKPSGYAEGHLIPGGRMLWIEGNIPADVYNGFYEQHTMGPSERYGKVLATGIFHYGGNYGHLGAFKYKISISEMQSLAWSP
jgi:hypothetical protein